MFDRGGMGVSGFRCGPPVIYRGTPMGTLRILFFLSFSFCQPSRKRRNDDPKLIKKCTKKQKEPKERRKVAAFPTETEKKAAGFSVARENRVQGRREKSRSDRNVYHEPKSFGFWWRDDRLLRIAGQNS